MFNIYKNMSRRNMYLDILLTLVYNNLNIIMNYVQLILNDTEIISRRLLLTMIQTILCYNNTILLQFLCVLQKQNK